MALQCFQEKQRIELEVQNGTLDPCHENVVEYLIQKMNIWFGKPQFDTSYESWSTFTEIKRAQNEGIEDFIIKYDTVLSEMKCSNVDVNEKIKTLQLIRAINVDEMQRRLIMTHVKGSDEDNLYESTKASIRLLKGSLIEQKLKPSEQEVYYGES